MQETIYTNLSDFRSRLTDGDAIEPLTSIQFTVIDKDGNNLLKDHQYRQLFDKFFIQETPLQIIERI